MPLLDWQISGKSCTETKRDLDCTKTFTDTLPPTQKAKTFQSQNQLSVICEPSCLLSHEDARSIRAVLIYAYLRKRMYRNKREILTLLLGKELNCSNTVTKHNEIYLHALLFIGCDHASASSLITSAFPLTILPLPVLIKAKQGHSILYAFSAILASNILHSTFCFSSWKQLNTLSMRRTIRVCVQ